MIQKNVVYHKTAKGAEAIATRQHGLTPKQRSILIMVDGRRGFEELARITQALGDPDQLLGQLLDAGLIEPVAGSAAPAPAASEAPAATTTPAALDSIAPLPTVTLKEAQRFAVRRLTDILGPNAEDFCLRIEAARNVHDFQVAVARAEGMVRQFKGSNKAAEFAAEMKAHAPSQ